MSKKIVVGSKEYEKEAYWCNECKRFHRYLFHGKPSTTHKKHFCYISKYKYEYSQTELFKLSFKKSWQNESVRQSKEAKRELFINEKKQSSTLGGGHN